MRYSLLLAAPLLFATAAHADAILRPGLTMGVEASHYQYKEPGLMSLTSSFASGITADYQAGIVRFEGRALYAPADYKSSQGSTSNELNYTAEGRVLLTQDFDMDGWQFAPYAGLGYRYLRNDGKDFGGFQGYDRTSQYLYAPLGIWAGLPLDAGEYTMVIGQLEAGPLLLGRQQTDLLGGFNNKQTSGGEARASLALRNGSWQIGPYAQYWSIASTDYDCNGSGYCGREPKNNTTELGLQASFHF